ncbi:MAG: U32 family peptidase [Cyclobacteriaceae bacterium]
MKHINLMAPAGSFESLHAAINAGCNSVYFGVEQLNMRARSSINFTTDDMREIASLCNDKGVATYLTLNTIMYDHDMTIMKSIVQQAYEAGISAIIASDHAVMMHANKVGIPVHISTQVNITNIETVEFYAAFAETMVLSRELSLSQVAHISREIERRNITGPTDKLIQLEVFAHGALCMAVSGKCYLSLHSHNASANRGACIQNCRRPYTVIDKDEGVELEIDNEYIMSAKDLCTIGFLDKVLEAGVSVLKIEGRGRSADYVDTTISSYREAIDAIQTGNYTAEKIAHWEQQLSRVFNRGFWSGYYLGQKIGEWNDAYGSKATTKKVFLGRSTNFFGKINVAEFKLETGSLKIGDEIIITGPTTGLVRTSVKEMRSDDRSAIGEVTKGDVFSTPLMDKVRPSDKLYKIVDA